MSFLSFFVQYQSVSDKTVSSSPASSVVIPDGEGGGKSPIDIQNVANLDHFFINLLTVRISRTIFSINPMVTIPENILDTMDLVQFILQVHRHGVIVSKSPVISMFVVDIPIVKIVVNNLHKDHIVLATGAEDVVIALLVFSVNSYSPFFASNRLSPLLSLLMLFLQ
jgi:hypothetical protein